MMVLVLLVHTIFSSSAFRQNQQEDVCNDRYWAHRTKAGKHCFLRIVVSSSDVSYGMQVFVIRPHCISYGGRNAVPTFLKKHANDISIKTFEYDPNRFQNIENELEIYPPEVYLSYRFVSLTTARRRYGMAYRNP